MTGFADRGDPIDEGLEHTAPRDIRRRTVLERPDAEQNAVVEHMQLELQLVTDRGCAYEGGRQGQLVDAIDRKIEPGAEASEDERHDARAARPRGNGEKDPVRHETLARIFHLARALHLRTEGAPDERSGLAPRRSPRMRPKSGPTAVLHLSTLRAMPAGDLTLTTGTDGGASIIHVVGELDLSTIAALDAELELSLPAGRVVVNLSECTFIDSSALRSLVRAQRAVSEGGGSLALVAPSQPARRVLEVAALDHFIPVFETVAEAVSSSA